MNIEPLSKDFYKYLSYISELRCKDREGAAKVLLADYLSQFERLFDVYEIKINAMVVFSKDYDRCKIYLEFGDTIKEGYIEFTVRNNLIPSKQEIKFGEDCIVINKGLSTANFTFIQGIIDCDTIMHKIEEAELELITKPK